MDGSVNLCMIAVDNEGKITHWSDAAKEMFGYREEEILGDHCGALFPENHAEDVTEFSYTVKTGVKAQRKDGSHFFVELHTFPLRVRSEHIHLVVIRDMMDYNKSKEEIKRLNLIIEAIKDINRLIVTEKDREHLLHKACEVLVERRRYKMAWIGFVEEESKTIRPVAKAGYERGYLESIKVTWDDTEYGKGPVGKVIKTGRPYIMKNILNDPNFEPWRKEALERGYISMASFPIAHEGKTYGILNVYSNQKDAFDEKEVNLLKGLADDIGYAIRNIDIKKEKEAAMDQIAENLKHFDLLADKLRNPLAIIQGYLELRDEFGEEIVFAEISKQVDRMMKILNELREKEKETYRLKLLYNGNDKVKQGEN